MGYEIERKFLFKNYPDFVVEFTTHCIIKQGYIFIQEDKHLRVRITKKFFGEEIGRLGLKFTDKNVPRLECESEIDINEAYDIYKRCKFYLEKKRSSILLGELKYDFDMYPNLLKVVEVEFPDELTRDSFIPPDWLGEEITGNSEFSNIKLAKDKLIF